jgi:serine/threonine protein kinase/formylglycine-generating enzyme required for sulfatase activity
MTPEHWEQIKRQFHAALEYEPAERPAFLARECASDGPLRHELESRLASHEQAKNFIETPASDVAAALLAEDQPGLVAGQMVGPFRIVDVLGAGGMGEVYLANDARLGRKIALKLLPPQFTMSVDRVHRFKQEARATSALNHPNIVTIHDIGQTESFHFIATEFIDGETLREHMANAGMPIREVLDVAAQVASALQAAHEAGVVHRDVKPENVMLRPDGIVKVLDFGLAKLTEKQPAADSAMPTQPRVQTETGMVMGTASYMSPEQARGLAVDARTDIWSLGVLLYEMAAGRLPFEGQTNSDVISRILQKEPRALTLFSDEADARLDEIVTKTLTKDREKRYQSAKDLFIDLKRLKHRLDVEAEIERTNPTELISTQGGARQFGKRQAVADGFSLDLKSLRDELQSQNRLGRPASVGISESTSPPVSRGVEITGNQPANQTIVADRRITIDTKQEKSGSKRIVAIVTAAVLLASIAIWFVWHRRNLSWARSQVPQIEALSSNGDYFAAYDLAAETQNYLTNDPTITRLMPTISDMITVTSEPSGAQVYLKRFSPDVAGGFPPRQLVGTTPIRDLRIARGQYLLYVEKDGFAKTAQTISGTLMRGGGMTSVPPPLTIEQKLPAADRVPNGTTLVTGGEYRLRAWARPTDAKVRLDDFLIDQYEVSNQDYKEFINAGGYLKKQYWTYPFIRDGKTPTWEEGIREFKDRTGLPGPRNWSSQNFPEGKANYPVTDVSWYEAAAYAAFRGKRLPTIYQWEKAARNGRVGGPTNYMPWGAFYPGDTLEWRANFEGDATIPVDSFEFGMSPFGAYNMAGNVSEWCLNETSEGFISAGGAWGEPVYTFARYGRFPGFYSSNKRGFRCAINLGSSGNDGNLKIEINKEIPVYSRSSDQDFARWVKAYDYVKSPLDPQLEKQETDEWTRERITFNGANGERAIAYLYLPRNFPRPLQVIHLLPASDVEVGLRSADRAAEAWLATEIKSGRAVFIVVLKGYIERLRPAGFVEPDQTTAEYRDKMVNWITDLRRGLDYLETRNDIDSKKIAFCGPSSGASVGLILAAVDRRYASVFLAGAGIRKSFTRWIAEANIVNFAPHIRGPILILQGRYDEALAWKAEAEPLYKLLRGPKRLILFDGGHAPPMELFATTIHRGLDETLGPVRKE